MTEKRVVCPECGTGLRLKREFGPRELVDCPRCEASFPAREGSGYRSAGEAESQKVRNTRGKPVRSRDEEDEDEDRPRKKKKGPPPSGNSNVLYISVGVGALVLVVITGLVVWLTSRGSVSPQVANNTPTPQPVPVQPINNPFPPILPVPQPQPPQPEPPPVQPQPEPPTPHPQPPQPQPQTPVSLPSGPQGGPSTTSGAMDRATLEKVKKATVYIRVTRPDGLSSGSGFVEEGSKMVLTNAHVLGMLSPSAAPPQKVELIFNSGLPEERVYLGTVVGVDRQSDLGILRLPTNAVLPEALKVVTAKGLYETQGVYIFGFPFGEKVGKNITVSQSSISSLRTGQGGHVEKVQVNGGMSPGNSGGPVVDDRGNVVGVAVSIITATQLNFAIPGESVHSLLRGRVSGLSLGEPVRRGTAVTIPATVSLLNPLGQIRSVEVQWWFGSPGQNIGPEVLVSNDQLATGQTLTASLNTEGNQATTELVLPGLPPAGKVLYVRPRYTSEGSSYRWVAAISQPIESPPEARPTTVVVRFAPARNQVKLQSTFTMRLNVDEEKAGNLKVNVVSTLLESVSPGGQGGILNYTVGKFEVGLSINDKAPGPSPRFQRAIQQMNNLNMGLQLTGLNNVNSSKVDVSRAPPDAQDPLEAMGSQMMQSLEIATIPMPHNGRFTPGQTWSGTRKVSLSSMDMLDLLDKQSGVLDITYTYKGVRQVGTRELPIIGLRGRLRGLQEGNSLRLGGEIRGEVALDPQTGTAVNGLVNLEVNTEVKVRGGGTIQTAGKLEVKISR